MEIYNTLVNCVGLIATPALVIALIALIVKIVSNYHKKLTKQIVYDYLQTLSKDD